MGDAGEGLIDADSRIQERLEEIERERSAKQAPAVRNPELVRALESLRLARTELERQLAATTHERRKAQITQAIAEIDRRMAEAKEPLTSRLCDARLPPPDCVSIGDWLAKSFTSRRLTLPHAGLALHPHHDRPRRRLRAGGESAVRLPGSEETDAREARAV